VTDAITTLTSRHVRGSESSVGGAIDRSRIFITGNTVIDALLETARKKYSAQSTELRRALQRVGKNNIILLTAHRRENFGEPFRSICSSIRNLSTKFTTYHWINPVHPNPNIIKASSSAVGGPAQYSFDPSLELC